MNENLTTVLVALLTGGVGLKIVEWIRDAWKRRSAAKRDELDAAAEAEKRYQDLLTVTYQYRIIGVQHGVDMREYPPIPGRADPPAPAA